MSRYFWSLDALARRYSIPTLCGLLAVTAFQKAELILHTDGGGDLLGADIPKSILLLQGQNPYLSNPWASPYPPFLLAIVGSIIRITSGNLILTPSAIGLISRNVRMVGVIADASVAILIYATLRARNHSGLSALIPASLFLVMPSISLSPYYWFNSDVFGYPILAGAIFALVRKHYLVGSAFLAAATVFKIHPILAIPLLLAWLVRRKGLVATIPSVAAASLILTTGLVVPILLPGYLGSVLGYNLSSGFGGGTSSFTLMNLLYGVLPTSLHLSLPITVENQVWLAATAGLLSVSLGIVWLKAQDLSPVDVIAIGVLIWLIPLRQIYTHYVVWAIVPFLMRGRLRQTLLVGGLLEFANTMASWSWDLPPDPFPVLSTTDGFFVTSLAYLAISLVAAVFIVRGAKSEPGRQTRLRFRSGPTRSLP